ncbi:hypothetical protein ACHAW6_009288 [Cyclotella cf. meneghiniana]
MNPNGRPPSSNATPPPTTTTSSPTPTKKLPTTPLPPRWRFVNDAKKARGYSTADAGTQIPGLSAEELAAKYRAPVLSEMDRAKRRDVTVGRLDICEGERQSEELLEGEFRGFRAREAEEEGEAPERGCREWTSLLSDEKHSLREPQDRSNNDSSQEEEDSSLFNERSDDPQTNNELEAGEMKNESIREESEISCQSMDQQPHESIAMKTDDTQQNDENVTSAENGIVSPNEDTHSHHSQEAIIAQEILLDKPAECEDADNHRITAPQKRKRALLSLLLLACALALSLGFLFGTRQKDNTSNQFNLSLFSYNATHVPSGRPSNYPSLSRMPSLSPTAHCPTGTKPFRVEIIRQQNLTGWTQAEIFAYDATWTLREACSEKVIMECLPCQANTRDAHLDERQNDLFDHSSTGAGGCLSFRHQYIFEVKTSGGIETCCGFVASEYVVTYDGNLIVEGETIQLAAENNTGGFTALNGETNEKLMEFRAYFGSQEEPCPTTSPNELPTFDSINPTREEIQQPSQSPSLKSSEELTISPSKQPNMIPTNEPTCSFNNEDFNLCFAIDMSGSVCNQGTGFECNSCEPALICNSEGVTVGTCCLNFLEVVTFAKEMVTSLGSLLSNQTYSVVQFATNTTLVTSLTSSNQVLDVLDEMMYTGGLTNHAEAIDACHQSLQLSPITDAKNLILLITDGDPSEPKETTPEFAATQAAEEAKATGTFIIPVMIAETLEPETLDYMKGISSDGSVFNVTDFKSLQMLQDTLITHVSCQT